MQCQIRGVWRVETSLSTNHLTSTPCAGSCELLVGKHRCSSAYLAHVVYTLPHYHSLRGTSNRRKHLHGLSLQCAFSSFVAASAHLLSGAFMKSPDPLSLNGNLNFDNMPCVVDHILVAIVFRDVQMTPDEHFWSVRHPNDAVRWAASDTLWHHFL